MFTWKNSETFWSIIRKHAGQDQITDLSLSRLHPNGGWDRLPLELIVKIFSELTILQIVLLTGVCHKFRTVIRSSTALSYRIECHISDVVDGDNQLCSMEGRHSRLQLWRLAWKTARQRWETGPASTIERTGDTVFACDGSLLVQVFENTQEILLSRLPSESRGIRADTWKLSNFDFDFELFGHNHTQGLLILIEEIDFDTADLHILSDRTGLVHPLASKSVIRVQESNGIDIDDAEGWIFGDHLAIAIRADDGLSFFGNQLRVYNWKTGELLKSLDGKLLWNISMLDERHILVPANIPMCEQPCLAVLDVSRGHDSEMPLQSAVMSEAILALQLPPVRYPSSHKKIEIWECPGRSTAATGVPFSPSHTSRVLVVTLSIGLSEDNPDDWDEEMVGSCQRTFIIPVSVFLSRLEAVKADQNQFDYHASEPRAYPRPVTILPWTLWGQDARLLPESSRVESICGSRVLVSENENGDEVVAIYDFASLPSLLEDIAAQRKNPEEPYSIPSPFHQPFYDFLETRVLSAAPFRRVATDFTTSDDEELVLYHDGVCVVKPDGQHPISVYSL